jgi:hypothetical protein
MQWCPFWPMNLYILRMALCVYAKQPMQAQVEPLYNLSILLYVISMGGTYNKLNDIADRYCMDPAHHLSAQYTTKALSAL